MSRGDPQACLLDDGRLHLQHGPIDLIVEAFGAAGEVKRAYRQATVFFGGVLKELAAELAVLKTPMEAVDPPVAGVVGRRMVRAVGDYRGGFITPMAAVAGAVADAVLEAMVRGCDLSKGYVNNGGDIALHLSGATAFTTGVVADASRPEVWRRITVGGRTPVRGMATSGWRGRSWSLGIADAVTVFARNAAAADAAATLIANAVNIDHPAIRRVPAHLLDGQSDLGGLPVTVDCGSLEDSAVEEALNAGMRRAQAYVDAGRVFGALLVLSGHHREVGYVGGCQTPGDVSRGLTAQRG